MSSIDLNDFNELQDEQNFDQDFDINEFQTKPLNDQNFNLSKNEKSKNEDISFDENAILYQSPAKMHLHPDE